MNYKIWVLEGRAPFQKIEVCHWKSGSCSRLARNLMWPYVCSHGVCGWVRSWLRRATVISWAILQVTLTVDNKLLIFTSATGWRRQCFTHVCLFVSRVIHEVIGWFSCNWGSTYRLWIRSFLLKFWKWSARRWRHGALISTRCSGGTYAL